MDIVSEQMENFGRNLEIVGGKKTNGNSRPEKYNMK